MRQQFNTFSTLINFLLFLTGEVWAEFSKQTLIPQHWFNVGNKETDLIIPVSAVVVEELNLKQIINIHQYSGHHRMKRTFCILVFCQTSLPFHIKSGYSVHYLKNAEHVNQYITRALAETKINSKWHRLQDGKISGIMVAIITW